MSLDAGYGYQPVRADLAERGITAKIIPRGGQAPIQTDGRWVCERTNSWMNNFGKLPAAPNPAASASSSTSPWPPQSSPCAV